MLKCQGFLGDSFYDTTCRTGYNKLQKCRCINTQGVRAKSRLLLSNQTFISLVPLLIFNGLEQGFVYAVYNKVLQTILYHYIHTYNRLQFV